MSDTIKIILAVAWFFLGILYVTEVIEPTPKAIAMLACFIIMHVLLFG